MTISDARRAAEEKVGEALAEWRLALRAEQDEPVGVITGWAAVIGETTYTDEGGQLNGYPICSPVDQPLHVDVGLLRIASEVSLRHIVEDGREG